MKVGIGFSFYLVYFLIIAGITWLLVLRSFDSVEEGASQAAEEVLVDTANILAERASIDVVDDKIIIQPTVKLIDRYLQRLTNANIYGRWKNIPDLHVYITNQTGIVLYDSQGKRTGDDFSSWRDVYLTLRGDYGARSSAFDPANQTPTAKEDALYIAAPIYNAGQEIIGVLTVYKPVLALDDYISGQTKQIRQYTWMLFLFALVIGAAMTWLLSRSISKLVDYANALAQGKKIASPTMQQHELRTLANSITHMREEIDGKNYVEDYIHTLTHELKTPITGIQSAAELLQSPMPEDKKQHFAKLIVNASERMTRLIERVLKLAVLEKQGALTQLTTINLAQLVQRIVKSREIQLQQKEIALDLQLNDSMSLAGEALLIEQAFSNILDNAIDFTPFNSTIYIQLKEQDGNIRLSITDEGPGIPEYAMHKVFERFFSTARPDTSQRSTGLGLSFVKEILALHGGEVMVTNKLNGGANIALVFQSHP